MDKCKEVNKYVQDELTRLSVMVESAARKKIAEIKPMPGGLTNYNFKFILDDGFTIAVRIPGVGTEDYIDREAERHNLTMMGNMGISPEIYYYDKVNGSMLSEFIHADTMHPEDFQTNYRLVVRAAGIMRTYHNCGRRQKGNFSVVANIRDFWRTFEKSNYKIPFEKELELWENIKKVNRILEATPFTKVPCHNDPLSENFMFDGHKMTMIDWEYAGMNDCYYDIAAFIVENQLSPEMEEDFLIAYIGNNPTDIEKAHVYIFKFLLDSYVFYWANAQLCAGKDKEIYLPYAEERINRAFGYVNSPEFDKSLQILTDNF